MTCLMLTVIFPHTVRLRWRYIISLLATLWLKTFQSASLGGVRGINSTQSFRSSSLERSSGPWVNLKKSYWSPACWRWIKFKGLVKNEWIVVLNIWRTTKPVLHLGDDSFHDFMEMAKSQREKPFLHYLSSFPFSHTWGWWFLSCGLHSPCNIWHIYTVKVVPVCEHGPQPFLLSH